MKNTLDWQMSVVVVLLLLLCGCGSQHAVVLVPDPDGQVGKAEVVTDGGRQLLLKANDMTTLRGKDTAPAPVASADPAYIQDTFGEVLGVEPTPSEKFILFFATGGATLTPESQAILPSIAQAVTRRQAVTVRISGHADAVGSAQVNETLARERAAAVRDLLQQQGVRAEIIEVSSHGKGNPLVPTPDGVAEPRNRRVEVVVR